MQFYQCKVRLAGSLMNEVFKADVSAPEIMLLRAFHGDDAVVDIVKTRVSGVSNDDERERLMRIYMNQKGNNVEQIKQKQGIWFGLFGPLTATLPTKLPGEYPEIEPEPQRTTLGPKTKRAPKEDAPDPLE